jgi:ABC-type nitrate/sulfonate/bicarbonate transport system permease component
MITAIETYNRTEGGIGSQIEIYCATNQFPEVYAYLVVIGCVAVVADWGFRLLRRVLFPYTTVAERA